MSTIGVLEGRRGHMYFLVIGILLVSTSACQKQTLPTRHPAQGSMFQKDDDRIPLVGDASGFEWEPIETTNYVPRQHISESAEISPIIEETINAYIESSRVRLQSIRRDGNEMLVTARVKEAPGAYLIRTPLGALFPLYETNSMVEQAGFVPHSSDNYMLRIDADGGEDYQLVRISPGSAVELTRGGVRSGGFAWSPSGKRIAFTANSRNPDDMDIYISDGKEMVEQAALERQGLWSVGIWSQNEQTLLLHHHESVTTSSIHLWDLEQGAVTNISTPGDAYIKGFFRGKEVYAISDQGSDWMHFQRYDTAEKTWTDLTPNLEWDVEKLARSADGEAVVLTVNRDGVNDLYLYNLSTHFIQQIAPPLESEFIVEGMRFIGSTRRLAMTINRLIEPSNVYVFNIEKGDFEPWTMNRSMRISRAAPMPRLVRIPSFDGLEIPAWVFEPNEESAPFPVILWMHGGPEEQFRPSYSPIIHYLTTVLGIAVVAPNIRGSEGYGRTYLSLDNGFKRMDAVKDVGAVLDWIEETPQLDQERTGIFGASYGGFMVLASLTSFPDRFAAGCDLVGMSDILSFLERTRGYRRDNRRKEYGDERDPVMRKFLQGISPFQRANEIRTPLFIAHGATDPRVPLFEAEQIAEAVQSSGVPVWMFVAKDEGHGFKRRQNRDAFYKLLASFFYRYLQNEPFAQSIEENPPSSISMKGVDYVDTPP